MSLEKNNDEFSKKLIDKFNERYTVDIKKCWNWYRAATSRGYGEFYFDGGRIRAHRFAYIASKGLIPDGFVLDHLCRNTMCVNPEHLEAVTQHENILRGESMSAHFAKRTHCNNGHEYTESNTLIRENGSRRCLICHRKYHSKIHAELKVQRSKMPKKPRGFASSDIDKNGMTGKERAIHFGRVKNKRKKASPPDEVSETKAI